MNEQICHQDRGWEHEVSEQCLPFSPFLFYSFPVLSGFLLSPFLVLWNKIPLYFQCKKDEGEAFLHIQRKRMVGEGNYCRQMCAAQIRSVSRISRSLVPARDLFPTKPILVHHERQLPSDCNLSGSMQRPKLVNTENKQFSLSLLRARCSFRTDYWPSLKYLRKEAPVNRWGTFVEITRNEMQLGFTDCLSYFTLKVW